MTKVNQFKKLVLLSFVLALILAGCKNVDMLIPKPIRLNPNLNKSALNEIITKVLVKRSWKVQYNKDNYQANIDFEVQRLDDYQSIKWTAHKIGITITRKDNSLYIKYLSSDNLGYSKNEDGKESIAPDYNEKIKEVHDKLSEALYYDYNAPPIAVKPSTKTYTDCILEKLVNVTSDVAAQAIKDACLAKYPAKAGLK